jgi:uncharacterized protein (TIGR02231 family)
MKTIKRHLSAILALAPLISTAAANSTIQQVELYPSGAAVTRLIEVEPSESPGVAVEIDGLPSGLLESSIQIAPYGERDLRIGGFRFLPDENAVKEDDPRTAGLRDKIRELDDALRRIRLEQEAIAARKGHYQKLAESIRESLEEAATGEAFELARQAWDSYEEVRAAGQARLPELAVEEKRLGIERAELQKDLDELTGSLSRRAAVLQFELAGNLVEGARLALRYHVREAGWAPVHEVRADPADGAIEWIYKARISQRSGEDWDGVTVVLNSASGLYTGGLPVLDPLYLQRMEERPPMPAPRFREEKAMVMQSMAMADTIGAEAVPESTTTGFFMRLPQPLSLESGKPAVVREAFSSRLDAEFWSEAAPELSTDAWLIAGLTNELGWPILAGELYAYIDNRLVARRHIEALAAGDAVELALGRNEKIVIERKERARRQSEGGLIDRTRRHEIKHETTVENRMPVAHTVILQDRFPVGRDNKIQVKIAGPRDVTPEEGTGLFKWERAIPAGGQAVLTTEYTVSYPAEWTIYPPL